MGKLIDIVQSQINAAREEQRLADAREKTNWQYRQDTLNSTAQLQAGIIQQGVEKGINIESLTKETKAMVANLANAKIRLGTADGPYAGSEWDEKFVANTQAEIASIGDTFSALLFVDEKYKETMQAKGVGDSEGMIDMSQTDPFFIIGQNIGNPNMDTQGKVSWKHEYSEENGGQWFRVTEGPEVEETYRRLYEETGNKKYLNPDGSIKTQHKTSYTENKNALDNANGDENNYGNQMATVPGLSNMNKELQDLKIMGNDNLLAASLFETSKKVASDGFTVYDKQIPKYNDIKRSIESFTNAEANLIAGSLNDGTGVSFLNSRSAKIAGMRKDSEGMLEMEVPREEGGEFVVDNDGNLVMETVKFGSPGLKGGRYVRDYTKDRAATKGYEQEDWKNLQRAYLWIKMSEMKATKPGKEVFNTSETQSRRANYNATKTTTKPEPQYMLIARNQKAQINNALLNLEKYKEEFVGFNNEIKTQFPPDLAKFDPNKSEQLTTDIYNTMRSVMPKSKVDVKGNKLTINIPYEIVYKTIEGPNGEKFQEPFYREIKSEDVSFNINETDNIYKHLISRIIGFDPDKGSNQGAEVPELPKISKLPKLKK